MLKNKKSVIITLHINFLLVLQESKLNKKKAAHKL